MGYVNNYDKNRYLENFSKAAVDDFIHTGTSSFHKLYEPRCEKTGFFAYAKTKTLILVR